MTVRRIITLRCDARLELAVDAGGAARARWLFLPPGLGPIELQTVERARQAELQHFARQHRLVPTVVDPSTSPVRAGRAGDDLQLPNTKEPDDDPED